MKLIAIAVVLFLTGCGKISQLEAHYTGHSKVCIDGVTYLQFQSGATHQVDREGRPVPCTTR